MILRDPVHGLVAFEGPSEEVVSRLLATKALQRLRRVRQLGLTSLVFPGAEHTRFAHAIGAAHVMTRLHGRMAACASALPAELRMGPEDVADSLAAALVHDVGHGPFSHLFEAVVPGAPAHESYTARLLLDGGTEIHRALESLSAGMSGRVVSLLQGTHRLGYLSRAVSSTLDVDRCDYLLRDSQMTGARYGLYDLDWLLQSLSFGQTPQGEWVLAVEGRKGLPPIEGFFMGRHFMFRQVYHHKATRGAECLVRGMFVRMAELVRGGSDPQVPEALKAAVLGDTVNTGDYLELDDALLWASFAGWERGPDAILADLAGRLRARVLPKIVPLPAGDHEAAVHGRQEALERVREIARSRGLRPDLHVWLDVTSHMPYAEPEDDSPDGVWVAIRHRDMARLGEVSFVLGELRNKQIEAPRLVFPAEIREDVRDALQGLLP